MQSSSLRPVSAPAARGPFLLPAPEVTDSGMSSTCDSESDDALDRLVKQRAERLAKKQKISSQEVVAPQGAPSQGAPSRAAVALPTAAPSQGAPSRAAVALPTAAPSQGAPSLGQPEPWQAWAAHIAKKARPHRDRLGRQKRKIRMVELCSGLMTATRAMNKVGLFDVVTIMSVDPSPAATKMAVATGNKSQHHFNRIADIIAASSAECVWHDGPCQIPLSEADILVIGLSCKPYSSQRVGRYGNKGSVRAHPDFYLMEEFLEVMRIHEIPLAIFENVRGFLQDDDDGGTPLERLVEELRDAGYSCLGMMLDARTWLPVIRDRFFLLIGRADLFDVADLRLAARITEEIESDVDVSSIKEFLFQPGDVGWQCMQKQWQLNQSRQRGAPAAASTQGVGDDPAWSKSAQGHRQQLLSKGVRGWGLQPWTGVSGHVQAPRLRGCGQTDAKKEILDLAFLNGCHKKGVSAEDAMCRQQPRRCAAENLFCDVSQGICRRPWTFDTLQCSKTSTLWYSFERDAVIDHREIFRLHGFDTPPEDTCTHRELQVLIGNCMAVPSISAVLHGLLCACAPKLSDCFEGRG